MVIKIIYCYNRAYKLKDIMKAHPKSSASFPALPPEVILPCDLPSWPTVQARMLQLQVRLLHS